MISTRELPLQSEDVVESIIRMFEIGRRRRYSLDKMSHTEHAMQAALVAEGQGAPQSLVVAALVHDIGHFLEPWPRDIAALGTNPRHEALGSSWLERGFGPEVTEPVRLHVAAKRYLCAVDERYLDTLSPSSLRSLELQGGPMGREEARRFEKEPYFEESLSLRRIDEAARQPGVALPDIQEFRGLLDSMLLYCVRG